MECLGCLLEMLLTPVLELAFWVVLLPVCLILSTPAVLVLAFFDEGSYLESAGQRYRRVVKYWEGLSRFV